MRDGAPGKRSTPRLGLGRTGEQLARRALESRGMEIVQTIYRCTAGEMDIIARAAEEWVFVDVKTRRGNRFGSPEDAVTRRKQVRLAKVAESFLLEHGLGDARWRIDVVAVEMDRRGKLVRLEVIEYAVSG